MSLVCLSTLPPQKKEHPTFFVSHRLSEWKKNILKIAWLKKDKKNNHLSPPPSLRLYTATLSSPSSFILFYLLCFFLNQMPCVFSSYFLHVVFYVLSLCSNIYLLLLLKIFWNINSKLYFKCLFYVGNESMLVN